MVFEKKIMVLEGQFFLKQIIQVNGLGALLIIMDPLFHQSLQDGPHFIQLLQALARLYI